MDEGGGSGGRESFRAVRGDEPFRGDVGGNGLPPSSPVGRGGGFRVDWRTRDLRHLGWHQ